MKRLLCRLGRHRWSERFYLLTGCAFCNHCGAVRALTPQGDLVNLDGLSPEQVILVKQGWQNMASERTVTRDDVPSRQ